MSKISFECFELKYTDKENVEEITKCLSKNYKDIMNFFNLKKLSQPVLIKIYDNIDEYRQSFYDRYHKNIEDWETARTNYKGKYIEMLSLKEAKKREGHSKENLDEYKNVLLHEFVHICHGEYNGNIKTETWFNEALATALTNQYPLSQKFDCTTDDINSNRVNYRNYCDIGRYLISSYGKDNILALAKDDEAERKLLPTILEGTKEYVENEKDMKYEHNRNTKKCR